MITLDKIFDDLLNKAVLLKNKIVNYKIDSKVTALSKSDDVNKIMVQFQLKKKIYFSKSYFVP